MFSTQSYVSLGNFGGSTEEYVSHLQTMYESLKGADSIDLADLVVTLAQAHQKLSNTEQARKTYEEAMEILSRLPQEHKRVKFLRSTILGGLGSFHFDAGELELATEKQKEVVKLRREVGGRDHASVAEALNNLGATYQQRQLYRKALEYHEEALDILMAHFEGKQEDPSVVLTFYNMGLCFRHLKYPQGDMALKKAATLAQSVFGPKHEVTTMILETI